MHIFSADGNFHIPQEVDVVSVPVGERFELLVHLDRPPGDYTIRAAADLGIQFISGYAVFSYERDGAATEFTSPPAAVDPAFDYAARVAGTKALLNALSLKPWPPGPSPQVSNQTFKFVLGGVNATTWGLNTDPSMQAMQTLSANLQPTYPAYVRLASLS